MFSPEYYPYICIYCSLQFVVLYVTGVTKIPSPRARPSTPVAGPKISNGRKLPGEFKGTISQINWSKQMLPLTRILRRGCHFECSYFSAIIDYAILLMLH